MKFLCYFVVSGKYHNDTKQLQWYLLIPLTNSSKIRDNDSSVLFPGSSGAVACIFENKKFGSDEDEYMFFSKWKCLIAVVERMAWCLLLAH